MHGIAVIDNTEREIGTGNRFTEKIINMLLFSITETSMSERSGNAEGWGRRGERRQGGGG